MRTVLCCLIPALSFAQSAAADPHLKNNVVLEPLPWSGQTHWPLRYARVTLSLDGATVRTVGPWIEVGEGTRDGFCSGPEAFDAADFYWPTECAPVIDPVGNRCGLPLTNRYWFGPDYNNPNSFDDMTVEPAAAGDSMFEALFAIAHRTVEQTYLVVAIYEDVGDPNNCGIDINGDGALDFPGDDLTSAFILDYGVTGSTAGWIMYGASVCDDPVGWIAPADGTGGQLLRMYHSGADTDFDGLPDLFVAADLALLAQPMLWFNEGDNNGDGFDDWDNPGTQTYLHWDDDTPLNHAFDLGDANADGFIDECYAYIFGLTCPGYDISVGGAQLGSAILWLSGTPPCPGDVNGDLQVDIADLAILLSNFGSSGGLPGDLDGDGDVALNDLALLLGAFGAICAPAGPPDPLANGPHAVGVLAEINLPNSVGAAFPGIPAVVLERDGSEISPGFTPNGMDAVAGFDVRAQVRYPARGGGGADANDIANGGPFPLVIIAHGNHPLFAGAGGDPSDENYRGYTYLQEHLARAGYISVSIDLDDFYHLFPGILARGWLVLCHVKNMEDINGTAGHALHNAIDMDHIAFMGHSRGGEAVVQAMRMNATLGGADGGPGFGPLEVDNVVFNLRAVWGMASTRFFDGTFNWDLVAAPNIRAVVPASNIVGGSAFVPFLGMYGDADGDVAGGDSGAGGVRVKTAHVVGTYDGSDADPKQFVWVEGANHNFWNTSWFQLAAPAFGDDGGVNVAARITAAQQQSLALGYGLSFLEGYIRDQAPYREFFRRPANERPAAPIAATNVHLQYQNRPSQRSVVDNFQANPALGTTSRGTAGVDTTSLVAPPVGPAPVEAVLNGGNEAGTVTQSWCHNTTGVLFRWDAVTDFYQTVTTDVNVGGYEVLSFRAALDRRGPGANAPLDLRVTLRDNAGRTATLQSLVITPIPVHQTRADDAALTKSMLKTVRLPLCRFVLDNPALPFDLTNITNVRFDLNDRAAGKMAFDDIEFSN